MGSSPSAHLVYGYDLGTCEGYKLAECEGEYGSLAVDWFDNGDDENSNPPDFATQVYDRLYAAIAGAPAAEYDFQRQDIAERHFGVEFAYSGGDETPGFILIAAGSESTVDWTDTIAVDLAHLAAAPEAQGWNAKLAEVLTVLGVTPTQDGPRWLVFPSYG